MRDQAPTKAGDNEGIAQPVTYTPSSRTTKPRLRRPQLAGASDAYLHLLDIRDADREHLLVFDLDVRHRIIARRLVAIGTLTGVDVHRREVFRAQSSTALPRSLSPITHPSGDCKTSHQ